MVDVFSCFMGYPPLDEMTVLVEKYFEPYLIEQLILMNPL